MELLKNAFSQFGVKEFYGKNHNPQVLKYFSETGHKWVKTDETAWCSAFMNWVAMKSNCEYSGELNARSWLNVGEEVFLPKLGDVVIFWRESKYSWKGHVGLFINETDTHINVLGGNQMNKVGINPYNKKRLLGYRSI